MTCLKVQGILPFCRPPVLMVSPRKALIILLRKFDDRSFPERSTDSCQF